MLKWSAQKWHKNTWCKLFGHRWDHGWYGSVPYLKPKIGPIDNLGELHVYLECECDRCGEHHKIANIHLSSIDIMLEKLFEKSPWIKNSVKRYEDSKWKKEIVFRTIRKGF